jgi:hypothetical protein
MSLDPTSWIAQDPGDKGDQTFAEWANGPGVGKWYVRSVYTWYAAMFWALLLAVVPVASLVLGMVAGVWVGRGLAALGVPESVATVWIPLIVGALATLPAIYLMVRIRKRLRSR